MDRIQTQDEIKLLLDEVYGTKKRLKYEDFKRINLEQTSEKLLSQMLMIQSSLPCSENFFRYKQNYKKYTKTEETEEKKTEGQLIASPKVMSRMAPI